MSDAVIISIVSTVGGIGVAYVVNVLAKKVQKTKANKQPKNRMEQMFDGYERLIQQKDKEDSRKARLIAELEEEISMTRQMVRKLEHALAISQRELELSRKDNQELKDMLGYMRKEYEKEKELDQSKNT